MKRLNYLAVIFVMSLMTGRLYANQRPADVLQVWGFSIAAPSPAGVDRFVKFIKEELAPRKINTLILRVDYNYQYKTHPELRRADALSGTDVKKIVEVCRTYRIRVIPQINLLGHQGGGRNVSNLLKVYPQFEEVPHLNMYKSYCPLHPDLHRILFALIDELMEAFEADAFHAGMDEVFYIGEAGCPRCGGHDKAELFANEVKKIRDHLKSKGKEMWIWGDRLIDAKAMGLGYWEGSFNDTYRAVDMIPKDVVVCDWHYNRAVKTDVYFANKGLRVITCSWKNPQVARAQIDDILRAWKDPGIMKENLQGVIHTVWSSADKFLDGYYGVATDPAAGQYTEWNTFRTMSGEMEKLVPAFSKDPG